MHKFLFIALSTALSSSPAFAGFYGTGGFGCRFDTLQEAIDAAAPDATIYARRGPNPAYEEAVANKNFTLTTGTTYCTASTTPHTARIDLPASATHRYLHVSSGVSVRISNLDVYGGREGSGGIIRNDGQLTLENVAMGEASASQGGCVHSTGSLSLVGRTSFTGCRADGSGGAISVHGGSLVANGAGFIADRPDAGSIRFVANEAGSSGGAVHLIDGTVALTNTVFFRNEGNAGGAVFADSTSGGTMDSVRFVENEAVYGGGLVHQGEYTPLDIRNVAFTDCLATPDYSCGEFRDNSSDTVGGAAVLTRGDVLNIVFDGNTAEDEGAAIASPFPTVLEVRQSLFTGHVGASVIHTDVELRIDQSTFARNTVDEVFEVALSSVWNSQIRHSLFDNSSPTGLDTLAKEAVGDHNIGPNADAIVGLNNLHTRRRLVGPAPYFRPVGQAVNHCGTSTPSTPRDLWFRPRTVGSGTDAGAVENPFTML